ncbi:MAG: hypothetical protein ACLUE7_01020 [Lachnospirales bacterium]
MEKSEIYAEIKREMERYRDYAINKSEEEIKAIYVKYPRIKNRYGIKKCRCSYA